MTKDQQSELADIRMKITIQLTRLRSLNNTAGYEPARHSTDYAQQDIEAALNTINKAIKRTEAGKS